MKNRFVILLLGLLLAAPLAAEPVAPRAAPSINAPYADPDFQSWQRTFERPGREVYDEREAIVVASGVEPGMVVADLGAGTGLFTLLFAERVGPDGRVYAVDISETFVRNVERRARQQGFEQVTGIVNTQRGVELPAGQVDLIFISDTYHHFERPEAMLASIRQALKPGGQLVVIDFRRDPQVSSGWVMGHVRAGKETARQEIEAAGFELVADEDLLVQNYFMRFVRPASASK